jgi:hypothetical protein
MVSEIEAMLQARTEWKVYFLEAPKPVRWICRLFRLKFYDIFQHPDFENVSPATLDVRTFYTYIVDVVFLK